jgi:NAD+ kinase
MKIVIFYTPKKKYVKEVLKKIGECAERNKLEVIEFDGDKEHLKEFDLAMVAGGDGTFLRAAYLVHAYGIPILGINLGGLGFLTDIRKEEIEEVFKKMTKNDYDIEKRMMLRATHNNEADYALNDVVLSTEKGRMIELEILINGDFVTNLRGDGLIISTPTGSTAYSLSSGGPILTPGTNGFVITPICPHTLTFRPLVVSGDSEISICSRDSVRLMYDGQRNVKLTPGETVHIRKSEHLLKVVKIKGKDYFQILRDKLYWGNR